MNIKGSREEGQAPTKERSIRLPVNFSAETLCASKGWNTLFKPLKEQQKLAKNTLYGNVIVPIGRRNNFPDKDKWMEFITTRLALQGVVKRASQTGNEEMTFSTEIDKKYPKICMKWVRNLE